MGNDLVVFSQKTACTSGKAIERVSLTNLAGTWFVGDQKIVIENSIASVYKRDESECWALQESSEIKDQQLYFQFKDHILSKGRMRADSNELMFRDGEDVLIWTREDPFYMADHEVDDMNWSTCLPDLTKVGSAYEIGGECLSLRHPSEMGANDRPKKCNRPELTPTDSYEEGQPIPSDSTEEPYMDDYLPPIHDLHIHCSPTILNSKSAIMVPNKGYDYFDSEDSVSDNSSEDSISEPDSSDFIVEASWVDDDFFSSEI